jgi:hypothetical protein
VALERVVLEISYLAVQEGSRRITQPLSQNYVTQSTYSKEPNPRTTHAPGVASPEGCRDISPGWSVFCDTRGFDSVRESHPGRGAWIPDGEIEMQ